MSGNPITVEGARLILQSAVDNGVCQEVSIDNPYVNISSEKDYQDDNENKKMMIVLQQRRRQEVGSCIT